MLGISYVLRQEQVPKFRDINTYSHAIEFVGELVQSGIATDMERLKKVLNIVFARVITIQSSYSCIQAETMNI